MPPAIASAALRLLLLVPAIGVALLALNTGGFFAAEVGIAATVLGVLLILRLLLARDALEAVSGPVVLAGGALALLAAWTLLSATWSDAPARATVEFDRVVLYLLAFALAGTIARTGPRVRLLVRGLAVAIAALCVCGLITRVLPEVWAAPENLEPNRLSWPVTYWNGLGLLAGVGTVLALHHAADAREAPFVRVVGAALVPLLATTALFTFSRGALAVTAGALVLYVVIARAPGLPAALLATVPATVVALVAAYDADSLASLEPASAAAVAQGHDLAWVLLACAGGAALVRALLLLLDRRLVRMRPPPRRAVVALAGAVVVLAAAGAVAADVPDRVQRQYEAFVDIDDIPEAGDSRERLTSAGNNGRLGHWDVALQGFRDEPLHGTGAGTFDQRWGLLRETGFSVVDAHSLYAEVLGELGLPGLLLVLVVLGTILVGLARRLGGPDRALYAALLACVTAWTVHAAVDWDWELPAVSLWVFAAGGLVLARPLGAGRAVRRPSRRIVRVGAAVAVLAIVATPAIVAVAHVRLRQAVTATYRDDCATAERRARASLDLLGSRPDPYEVLAWCALRRGQPRPAVQALADAILNEPKTARLHRELALMVATAGGDPRPGLRRAHRMDPLDGRTIEAQRLFRDSRDRALWRVRALAQAGQLVGLDQGFRPAARSAVAAPRRR